MLGRTRVAHYGRRCLWAHSEGHIGVAHYGILVGEPLQLRWQPIGRRCLWAHLGEVPTEGTFGSCNNDDYVQFFYLTQCLTFYSITFSFNINFVLISFRMGTY